MIMEHCGGFKRKDAFFSLNSHEGRGMPARRVNMNETIDKIHDFFIEWLLIKRSVKNSSSYHEQSN